MILREQRKEMVSILLAKRWEYNYVLNKDNAKKMDDPFFIPNLPNPNVFRPALCIGAGPSLRKNIGDVKAGLYEIIVCDKAAPWIIDKGIVPEYVVALNAEHTEVGWWLQKANNKKTTLIVPLGVHPDTYAHWDGPIKFINAVTASGLHERATSELNIPPITIGSNAGTFAYNVAAMTNHNPIGYIGMDFSFLQECNVLAKQNYPKRFNVIKMTDINGDVRYLDIGWFDMAQAFQEAAFRYGQWNGIRTYNCTEGGINYSEHCGQKTLKQFNEMIEEEMTSHEQI